MKKIIVASVVSSMSALLLAGSAYAYNALVYHVDAPVWQFAPDAQNPATSFASTQQVNVYKFSDGSKECYVALAPAQQGPQQQMTYTPAISCVIH